MQLSPFQLHLGRHELELSKDKELPAHGCRARSLESSSTFARPCQVYNALEDQGKKWFKQILRAQGILEEKTTEFDWTGLSPGPEIHFLGIVLKWRNGWLLIYFFSSPQCKIPLRILPQSFHGSRFPFNQQIHYSYKTTTYNIFTQVLYHNQMLLTDANLSFFKTSSNICNPRR